jgi:hypothetical protein
VKLETHAKIGIWVGIIALVISMTFFTLHESQELKYQYGRIFVDPDKMYDKLASTGTAEAFIEKAPYFYEEFDIRRDGSGRLELYSINNQTGNKMELQIRYDQDDDKLRENIHCQYSRQYEMLREESIRNHFNPEPTPEPYSGLSRTGTLAMSSMYLEGHARDQFVMDFIKITDCLDDPTEEQLKILNPSMVLEPGLGPEPEPVR